MIFEINPDQEPGIDLHLQVDELIPHHVWLGDADGDGFPDDDGWKFFNRIKQNGSPLPWGGFGSPTERLNYKTIAAKKLFFRYAIFADHFGEMDDQGIQRPTSGSGIAEVAWGATAFTHPKPGFEDGANDFFVTLGLWTTPGGTWDQRTGTFMHELGHTLGIMHEAVITSTENPITTAS